MQKEMISNIRPTSIQLTAYCTSESLPNKSNKQTLHVLGYHQTVYTVTNIQGIMTAACRQGHTVTKNDTQDSKNEDDNDDDDAIHTNDSLQ